MTRRLLAVGAILLAVTFSTTCAGAEPTTPPAPPQTVPGNPCGPAAGPQCGAVVPADNGPTTIGGVAGNAADAVGNAVPNAVGAAAGAAASTVTSGVFDAISKGMISWSTGILQDVTRYIQQGSNQPDLGAKPFDALYAKMEVLGAVAAAGAFLVFLCGTLRGTHTAHANLTAVARLGFGAVLMPNIPRLVDLGYQGINTFTGYVSSGLGGDLSTITTAMAHATSGLGPLSSGLGFLIAVLTFVAAGLILFDLILLGVVVPIIVAFAPILIGLAVHEAMVPVLKRVAVVLVAAMVGGFVIATCASVGAAILVGTTGNDLTMLIEGSVILILTAFAPFALARLIQVQAGLRRHDATRPVGSAVRAGRTVAAVL